MPMSGADLNPTNGAYSETFTTLTSLSASPTLDTGLTIVLIVLSETGVASLSHAFDTDLAPVTLGDSQLSVYRRTNTSGALETYTITQNSAGRCFIIFYQTAALYPEPLVGLSTPVLNGSTASGSSVSTGFTIEQAEWNVFTIGVFVAENLTTTALPTWDLYTNSFAETQERSAAGTAEAKTLAAAHAFPQHYGPYETEAVLTSAVSCSTAAVMLAYRAIVDPPYFVTGFETGTLAGASVGTLPLYPVITGAPTITTTSPATGSYALRCTSTAATCAVGVNPSLMGQLTSPCVGTIKVLFPTTLPAADVDLVTIVPAAGNRYAIRFRASDNTLVADLAGGGGTAAVGPPVVADTRYTLEWWWTNAATLDWRVNGVAQSQFADGNGNFLTTVHAGWAVTATTADVIFDDWCLSATAGDYPMGAAKVVLLGVDPAGTVAVNTPASFSLMSANGTINSTFNVITARDALTEVPPSIGASANGFVQDAADTAGHVDIPLTTYTLLGGEAVLGLRAIFCGWAVSTTAATLGFRVFNGTTEQILQAGTVNPAFNNSTTAPGWFAKQASLPNFDTQAKIDACQLRVGWASDATPDIGIQWAGAELAVGAAIPIPSVTKRRRKERPQYRR